jgi:aminopeptidase N
MGGYGSLVTQSMVRSRGRGAGPPPTIRLLLDEAFPREVSRQWWGNTLTPVSLHDTWLSNGFSNFSTSLYDLAAYLKPDEFKDHWVKAREALLVPNRFGVKLNDAGPVWMGMLNDTFKTAGAGNILSSYKGGFIVHMLRSLMYDPQTQDADFRAMMQDYVKRFTNHSVSTEDFQRLVEQHMKPAMDVDGNHRMDWFFREWVYGTDVPSYRLEYSVAAEKGGKPVVSGKLTQSGVSEGFRMRVPVFAELAGRKVLIGAMVMRGNSTADFKTALPEQPKRILLNINHEILTDREEVKLVK